MDINRHNCCMVNLGRKYEYDDDIGSVMIILT